jgi:hypothetical protein
MKTFTADEETPIEEYPGFLGMSWDGIFYPGPKLEVLKDFEWNELWELVDENGDQELVVSFTEGPQSIKLEAWGREEKLLDQVPGIDVFFDAGPPDAGPASGSGYIYISELAAPDLSQRLGALVDALNAHLITLHCKLI